MPVSRSAAVTRVYLDGIEQAGAKVSEISRSVGARRPDSCTFEIHPFLHTRRTKIQDVDLAQFTRNAICIVTNDGPLLPNPIAVHYGRVVAADIARSETGEAVTVSSRMMDHMLGDAVRGSYVLRDRADVNSVQQIEGQDVVFNPTVDGLSLPNRSERTTARLGNKTFAFVDPLQIPRSLIPKLGSQSPSSVFTQAKAHYWTLALAVEHLLWTLNANQTHVKNPPPRVIDRALGNVILAAPFSGTVPVGTFLGPALDMLLEPYGVSWYVKLTSATSRQFEFVPHRPATSLTTLSIQRPDNVVDFRLDQIPEMGVTFDIDHQAANAVTVLGASEMAEATFTLTPGWKSTHDTHELEGLRLGSQDVIDDPELVPVWREWVGNETGEYDSLRTDHKRKGALDLSKILSGPWIARRRQLHETITTFKDGTPYGGGHRGTFLEFKVGDDEWKPIESIEAPYQLLKDEIGIRFVGALPPIEFYDAGIDDVQLRITASIEGDERIAADSGANPLATHLADAKRLIVDMGDAYQLRTRGSESVLADTTLIDKTEVGERDDRVRMQEVADRLLRQWNQATCDGTITLEGVDWQMELGVPIKGIRGRNVDFNLKSNSSPQTAYPIIAGLKYRVDEQRTILQLDTLRQRELV